MGLVWREQLSVGNDLIDADHKHLIHIINQVEESLQAKSRSGLTTAFDDLAQYSLFHFDREEKIAVAAEYAQASHLKHSHEALLKQLEQVRAEFEAMGQAWSSEAVTHLTAFLRSWLIDHVIKEDMLMKPALQKHSPRLDVA